MVAPQHCLQRTQRQLPRELLLEHPHQPYKSGHSSLRRLQLQLLLQVLLLPAEEEQHELWWLPQAPSCTSSTQAKAEEGMLRRGAILLRPREQGSQLEPKA